MNTLPDIDEISDRDEEIALQCLKFVISDLGVDEFEFHPRLGVDKPELANLIANWPNLKHPVLDEDYRLMVNNCFNEVCNGLRILEEEWTSSFTATRNEVSKAYDHWRPYLFGNFGIA